MGRRPCCAKVGLNRGAWTAREDKILSNYIKIHGEGKWRDLPQKAGLKRCGKSCRLRWLNYLRPDIRRGNISVEEEELIVRLHKLLGNRWSLIAGRLPGRTDNEIKNYWNTNLGKRLQGQNSQNPSKQIEKLKEKETIVKSHPVIRTKAVRITKPITPQQLDNQMIKKDESSSSPHGDDSSNFLMDFDFTDLFLSDVNLNSEFHEGKEGNKDNGNVNGGYANGMKMCSESEFEALLNNSIDEALLENWRPSDPFQPNDQSLDLKAFASVLESEDHEWTD